MTEHNTQLTTLLERARQGDTLARNEIVTLYRPLVRRILSRQFDKLIRHIQCIYDLDDAEQSFWRSVLPQVFAREFLQDLESSPEYLLTFLLAKTHDKAVEIRRRFLDCQKRDLRRQQGLELLSTQRESAGQDTDPIENAITHETWDRLLDKIPPESILREALLLLRDGHGASDVAARLDISRSALRRLLQRLCVFTEAQAS